MNNKILIGGAIAASLLLILGGNFFSNGSVIPEGNSVNTGHVGASVGDTGNNVAHDFTLRTLDGDTITLSDYIGEKPVVLDFFATWCPNCRRDMPKLSRMYEKYGDQVEVIGINLQEKQKKVEEFSEDFDISFPIVMDPQGIASRVYGVQYTNYHVLIDKGGNIVGTIPGDIQESNIISLISL